MNYVIYDHNTNEYYNLVTKRWSKYLTCACVLTKSLSQEKIDEFNSNKRNYELLPYTEEVNRNSIVDQVLLAI
jgi:hypothetical protein